MRTQIQDVKLDNLLICPGVGKMLLTFEQMVQSRTVNILWYGLDNEVLPFGSKLFIDCSKIFVIRQKHTIFAVKDWQ